MRFCTGLVLRCRSDFSRDSLTPFAHGGPRALGVRGCVDLSQQLCAGTGQAAVRSHSAVPGPVVGTPADPTR